MCGICGFTGKTNPFILRKMTDSIIHRGPDEVGFYSNDKVNLGIRRLSIIDIKTGHQPIHNEDKTIWLVFNGEIYNFIELRHDLEKKGHVFYTDHSDSEVLIHLYEEHGDDFVHKLNGMFAISLWDNRSEKLLLIRDRMGVKPFFYSQVNGEIIFASEIKAILANPNYKKVPDYDALAHYFTFKHIPSPLTSFKGIFSVLPGEMVIYKKGNIEKKRYWKSIFSENYNLDETTVTRSLFSFLEDSVRLRMRSDVPFGVYLSGGVDSSSIAALMTKFSNKPIKTFSLGYEGELKNKEADLYYARKISGLCKTEHHEYIMSHNELIQDIGDVIGAFDQPFSGTISTYFLSKLIKKHVKVALSGDGADELFGSYLSHRVSRPMYHFTKLQDRVKQNTLKEEDKKLFLPCDINFLEALYKKSGGDEVKWRYSLYLFSDTEKKSLFTDKFKRNLKGSDSFMYIKGLFNNLTANDPLNRILEAEWSSQFPDEVLSFVDSLSMAHSVEIRSPFLDYRLVEFVSTIPGNMKIKEGTVKYILKKAVENILPEEITARPKEGFVLPIFDWMAEKLKGYAMEILSDKRLDSHGLLDKEYVKDILRSYYSGDKNNAAKIWNLMMFQIWWEKYFEK
jgi:asparagine synthase (glutamine-hydrolysing)